MRSWRAVSLSVCVAVVATAIVWWPTIARAGSRVPKRPDAVGKVAVKASGNTVRYTVTRGGRARVIPGKKTNPDVVTCRRWTTETSATADGAVVVTHHRWRQCFSKGRPTGPAKEIPAEASGSQPSEDVWTAVVPDPVIQRQNGVRFVTQRMAWVWLPAQYFQGIRVDLRSNTGQTRAGAAVARATQVIVHPGWGGESNGLDCTVAASFPYEPSTPFWDQKSCGLLYMKSSVDEPGGSYLMTATVTWDVNAVIDGETADPATVTTEGQIAVTVEELQALVTCVGGHENDCTTATPSKASQISTTR